MSKVKRSIHLADFYKSYCLRMKDKNLKPKGFQEYKKIIRTMGVVYRENLLSGGIVGLAWGQGDVLIKDKKGKKPAMIVKDGGKSVLEFNDHTEGVVKTIFWHSPKRKNKQSKTWCFSAGRELKRSFAKNLLSGKQYPDFTKMINI